jgi:anti-sigma factor RsiW
MNRATETELMRLLHGELPAEQAGALRARLEREPELAAAWERMERTWTGLDLPPAAAPPAGLAQRVLARARREAGPAGGLAWATAPVWVRASAAAALAAGLALGVGAGVGAGGAGRGGESRLGARVQEPEEALAVSPDVADTAPSLAEAYWDSLEDLESTSDAADGETL